MITTEMVEAACRGYWPAHWPQSMDAKDATSIRRHMRQALEAAMAVAPKATHRHKKRGSEYVLIGYGKMQAEGWSVQTLGEDEDGRNAWARESVDMREVAIYRSVSDGALWVRPREEFEGGRFEALDT